MHILSKNKQLTKMSQPIIGSHGKQRLFFPLLHLILCSAVDDMRVREVTSL